jgi:hypothetical protein
MHLPTAFGSDLALSCGLLSKPSADIKYAPDLQLLVKHLTLQMFW